MNRNFKKYLITLFLCILLLVNASISIFSNNVVSGFEKNRNNTYYVGGSGPGNYTSIQNAINNADPGSTIIVYNDTYFENLNINKELTLQAKNNNYPIINGQFIANVVNITAEGVEFKGFTIMHSGECSPELYAGININAENTVIIANNITRNSAFGIRINASNNIIKDNYIKHNCGEGIFITSEANNNIIYNNFLLDNTFDTGNNSWNISITPGKNIIEGPYISGNYWHDYQGSDFNSDALGDTELPHNNSGHIVNGGDYHPLTAEIFIFNISNHWNYVSIPLNLSFNKNNLLIYYEDNKYYWDEATTNNNPTNTPLFNKFIFGWNRSIQSFQLNEIFKPGYGYWMFAYHPCTLRINTTLFDIDDDITTVYKDWNIISIPFNQPVDKTDIIVDDVSWNMAVSNGWISDFIFTWNKTGQYYTFSDTFNPGEAYWMYSYKQCFLKRNV